MVMTLTVNESGCVYHLKRPGAVLNAGDIIARLDLDDASIVTKAQLYDQGFSPSKTPLPREDEKLNHIYHTCRAVLDNVLDGKPSQCLILMLMCFSSRCLLELHCKNSIALFSVFHLILIEVIQCMLIMTSV